MKFHILLQKEQKEREQAKELALSCKTTKNNNESKVAESDISNRKRQEHSIRSQIVEKAGRRSRTGQEQDKLTSRTRVQGKKKEKRVSFVFISGFLKLFNL